MSAITIGIHPSIFTKFPQAKVGVTLIDIDLFAGKTMPKDQINYLSDLKQSTVRQLVDQDIDSTNFATLPVCRSWESVFGAMGVVGKQSTILNLLRRATTEGDKVRQGKKADLGKISNFVDFYNCISIQEKTPMGALDLSKINGDISLRFGNEGDRFLGLGRDAVEEEVKSEHIVYADQASVLTHLWNYRDAAHACVPREGNAQVLLFADQAEDGAGDVEAAILHATRELYNIKGYWKMFDVLTSNRPTTTLNLNELITK